MNTYVMSDIHGCYDEFQQMLAKIKFGKDDLLICAGDYIDRGTKNYEMMNWIVNAPDNVIFVRGNHDEEFAANIDIMKTICEKVGLDRYSSDDSRTLHKAVQELAKQNGNTFFDHYGTIGKLIHEELIPFATLCEWAEKVEKMPYYYHTEVNRRNCVIVHAGYIESLENVDTEEIYNSREDFCLYARDDAYMCGGIEHGMIIAGHTPTTEDEEFPYNDGNVYRMYDEDLDCVFYDVDCGCAMSDIRENAKLACIRLEDEKIFYVKKSDKYTGKELYLDGMMGLVVGDALGVPVEFSGREEMREHPIVDMMGYGTYPVPAGSWSDDSSLAIYEYKQSGDVATCGSTGVDSNGNGSLMRILPVCIYLKYLQEESGLDDNTCIEIIHNMSAKN